MTVRYVAFDLLSGVQLGEVPLGGVSYTEGLNAECTLNGRVDLAERTSDGTVLGSHYRELLLPGKVKLAVVPDDDDPISFIVWERTYDGTRFLNVKCKGIWAYFDEYPLSDRKAYVDAEQHDIARDLVTWVEQQPASDIGIRLDSADSGVRRTRAYDGFEHRPVGEIIAELATAVGGFEYSIESSGGVRAVVDTWVPHYPRQGTTYAEAPKTIGLDRVPATLALSEGVPTTTLTMLGAGEGVDMAKASITAQTLLDEGYPQWPAAVPSKVEATTGVLEVRVVGELLSMLRKRRTWTLSAIKDTERYEWSEINVGDEVRIEVLADKDLLYPEGLNILQRVVGRTLTIDDDGTETIAFEFGDTTSTIPVNAPPLDTFRVVGTGDSILAMSWGFSSPGGVLTSVDRWLDFEHGRAPYAAGLAHRYSTAGIWPLLERASEPFGWVIVQDNSLGTTDVGWEALMTTIRNGLADNRNLVAVLPGYLASVNATIAASVAARAVIMRTVLGGHPRANFVDLAAYMVANPTQFVDGQHPNATAQAWIRAAIEALTG